MRKNYGEIIRDLKPEEVMMFGSNYQGFHGAGAAGFASFGIHGDHWRDFNYDSKPNGWKGRWNVKGVIEGFQEGTDGKSYAIPTITRPGAKRSISPKEITASIRTFYDFASSHPEWVFLVSGSSAGDKPNRNGYTHEEMCSMYISAGPIPDKVIFSESYTAAIFRNTDSVLKK